MSKKLFDSILENMPHLVGEWVDRMFDEADAACNSGVGPLVFLELDDVEARFWDAWAHGEIRIGIVNDMMHFFSTDAPDYELFSFDVCGKYVDHLAIIDVVRTEFATVRGSSSGEPATAATCKYSFALSDFASDADAPRAELAFKAMHSLYTLMRTRAPLQDEDAEVQEAFLDETLRRRAKQETTEFARALAVRLMG